VPQTRDRLTQNGAEVVGDTPEHFAARLTMEVAKRAQIVAISGARID
jgi:hypothetical protein